MKSYCTKLLSVLALCLAMGPFVRVQAQTYPGRPIKLLVPLAAGSTADIVSRLVGAELAKAFGQPVVVDNKPGAGGTIPMAELARAPAGG